MNCVFKVGDRVLLRTRTKELLDAAPDICTLRLWRNGPFVVSACPSPNAYSHTLALPRRMLCSPTVNVDRLKPSLHRDGRRAGSLGEEGEHAGAQPAVGQLSGGGRFLVRRRGNTSAKSGCWRKSSPTVR
jgi:hypothetical protein